MRDRNNNSENNNGLLMGFLFGAVIGMLISPESGEKNREKVKKVAEKAKKEYETIKPKVQHLAENSQETIAFATEEITGIVDQIEQKTRKIKTDLKNQQFFKGNRKKR